MNPLLELIFDSIAHDTARSALPGAPVLEDAPRAAGVRSRVGTALHRLAARIEPGETARREPSRYRTA
jgi:hypothetical protein